MTKEEALTKAIRYADKAAGAERAEIRAQAYAQISIAYSAIANHLSFE